MRPGRGRRALPPARRRPRPLCGKVFGPVCSTPSKRYRAWYRPELSLRMLPHDCRLAVPPGQRSWIDGARMWHDIDSGSGAGGRRQRVTSTFVRAGDGNRTRVLSLGSWTKPALPSAGLHKPPGQRGYSIARCGSLLRTFPPWLWPIRGPRPPRSGDCTADGCAHSDGSTPSRPCPAPSLWPGRVPRTWPVPPASPPDQR